MDTVTIVTIAAIVLANIGTTIGLFTWATNHAANDNKALREAMERSSAETLRIMESIKKDSKEWREKWADESKNFHGRLISIEERNSKRLLKD